MPNFLRHIEISLRVIRIGVGDAVFIVNDSTEPQAGQCFARFNPLLRRFVIKVNDRRALLLASSRAARSLALITSTLQQKFTLPPCLFGFVDSFGYLIDMCAAHTVLFG